MVLTWSQVAMALSLATESIPGFSEAKLLLPEVLHNHWLVWTELLMFASYIAEQQLIRCLLSPQGLTYMKSLIEPNIDEVDADGDFCLHLVRSCYAHRYYVRWLVKQKNGLTSTLDSTLLQKHFMKAFIRSVRKSFVDNEVVLGWQADESITCSNEDWARLPMEDVCKTSAQKILQSMAASSPSDCSAFADRMLEHLNFLQNSLEFKQSDQLLRYRNFLTQTLHIDTGTDLITVERAQKWPLEWLHHSILGLVSTPLEINPGDETRENVSYRTDNINTFSLFSEFVESEEMLPILDASCDTSTIKSVLNDLNFKLRTVGKTDPGPVISATFMANARTRELVIQHAKLYLESDLSSFIKLLLRFSNHVHLQEFLSLLRNAVSIVSSLPSETASGLNGVLVPLLVMADDEVLLREYHAAHPLSTLSYRYLLSLSLTYAKASTTKTLLLMMPEGVNVNDLILEKFFKIMYDQQTSLATLLIYPVLLLAGAGGLRTILTSNDSFKIQGIPETVSKKVIVERFVRFWASVTQQVGFRNSISPLMPWIKSNVKISNNSLSTVFDETSAMLAGIAISDKEDELLELMVENESTAFHSISILRAVVTYAIENGHTALSNNVLTLLESKLTTDSESIMQVCTFIYRLANEYKREQVAFKTFRILVGRLGMSLDNPTFLQCHLETIELPELLNIELRHANSDNVFLILKRTLVNIQCDEIMCAALATDDSKYLMSQILKRALNMTAITFSCLILYACKAVGSVVMFSNDRVHDSTLCRTVDIEDFLQAIREVHNRSDVLELIAVYHQAHHFEYDRLGFSSEVLLSRGGSARSGHLRSSKRELRNEATSNAFIASGRTCYTIKGFNSRKLAVLMSLDAVVQRGHASSTVLAWVDSELLKKDVRKALSIDRRLITLPEETYIDRRIAFSAVPEWTIENDDPVTRKFIVTFPEDMLEHVSALSKWSN